MGIGRVSRGTASGKAISTLSISGVAVAAGSCLELALGFKALNGMGDPVFADSVTWNGLALVLTASVLLPTSEVQVYRLDNAAGGTGDVVADFSSAGPVDYVAMIASEVTGPTASPFDQSVSASGFGTAPSSGAAPTTSQPNELLAGWFAIEGPATDYPPSWLNGFSAGQREGTTGGSATLNITLMEGYQVTSAAGSFTAAGSGMVPARDWAAFLLTFKEAAAGPGGSNLEALALVVAGDEGRAAAVDGSVALALSCGDPTGVLACDAELRLTLPCDSDEEV